VASSLKNRARPDHGEERQGFQEDFQHAAVVSCKRTKGKPWGLRESIPPGTTAGVGRHHNLGFGRLAMWQNKGSHRTAHCCRTRGKSPGFRVMGVILVEMPFLAGVAP
jgi:hypothetical protein